MVKAGITDPGKQMDSFYDTSVTNYSRLLREASKRLGSIIVLHTKLYDICHNLATKVDPPVDYKIKTQFDSNWQFLRDKYKSEIETQIEIERENLIHPEYLGKDHAKNPDNFDMLL